MDIRLVIENELVQDESQVWRLKGHDQFNYSDGSYSEKFLYNVFNKTKDLSSSSSELESYIKDWTSEYYFSHKRAQLLSGFSFPKSSKVLEVGCGCGTISRFLGEKFDKVLSIEGSINRARLARHRTKDLESVSIVCAPFQEIKFSQKFDIIFCIGVFEYSASFIKGDDPYDTALQYFSEILAPGGTVVIAIENQFGLKYFNGAREDHLGIAFEGLEGYHQKPNKVYTFGRIELENKLKKHFSEVDFYYPYPDYKIPSCILSEEFIDSGFAGELLAQIPSRDYSGPENFIWDEASVILELNKNKLLKFFSNSFILIASSSKIDKKIFNQQAILYSNERKAEYRTKTRILKEETGELLVVKQPISSVLNEKQKFIKMIETSSPWVNGVSLNTSLLLKARSEDLSLEEIFRSCQGWIDFLINKSYKIDDVLWLEGKYLDAIWQNFYHNKDKCILIDQEWIWHEKIKLNVIVIRAICNFLFQIDKGKFIQKNPYTKTALSVRSGKKLIKKIANTININLTENDFLDFLKLEKKIIEIVSQSNKASRTLSLQFYWFFLDRPTLRQARHIQNFLSYLNSKIITKFFNILKI